MGWEIMETFMKPAGSMIFDPKRVYRAGRPPRSVPRYFLVYTTFFGLDQKSSLVHFDSFRFLISQKQRALGYRACRCYVTSGPTSPVAPCRH